MRFLSSLLIITVVGLLFNYLRVVFSQTVQPVLKPITPCPKRCDCKLVNEKYMEVDCTQQKMSTIPPVSEWPENVVSFDISMNEIKVITITETNDNLEYLDLASNIIEHIEPNAFEHLPSLAGIDLSYNKLNTIPTQLFNKNLLILNVSHNIIEYIPENIIEKAVYLQELRLGHNPLKLLDPGLFKYSYQLKILDLSGIGAFELQDDLFNKLSDLTELDLSDNDFMFVPTTPIRSAPYLRRLRLSGNPIRFLDEHSFVEMSSLNELYLDDMQELIDIKEKTFSYLYHLKKISISNNPHLSYIDDNAFYGIFNRSYIAIREVELRANRLTTLLPNTLPFCNLTSLDLRENPWTCDCHLLWVKHCHLKHELSKGILCSNPSPLRGRVLNLIDETELICDNNHN